MWPRNHPHHPKECLNLPDGRVIAMKRDTGEIIWDKMVATTNEFGSKEKFYTAPITAEGKVIIANGAGDGKTRGWIAALDARTGNERWRGSPSGARATRCRNTTRNHAPATISTRIPRWRSISTRASWGIDPETGKPLEYNPRLDVQIYNPEARARRGDGTKRTCPTWHGGVSHQPTAYNPIKHIAYGVGIEGCFSSNGAAGLCSRL